MGVPTHGLGDRGRGGDRAELEPRLNDFTSVALTDKLDPGSAAVRVLSNKVDDTVTMGHFLLDVVALLRVFTGETLNPVAVYRSAFPRVVSGRINTHLPEHLTALFRHFRQHKLTFRNGAGDFSDQASLDQLLA